jgi:hypothetical protein
MMFLVNVLILYLTRTIGAVKLFRSRNWPVYEAKVLSATTEGKSGYVYYQYFVNGQSYDDLDIKLFLRPGPAKVYACRFQPGGQLTVRVKPGDPSVSVLEKPRLRWRGRD